MKEPVATPAERPGVSASTAYLWMKAARTTPQFARLVAKARSATAALIHVSRRAAAMVHETPS
jgi:hypothetical protein